MSDARVMQTVIQIDGLMSSSLKKAVEGVNRQLSTIDKKALETASKLGGSIADAAKTAAAAVAGLGTAAAGLAAGAFVKGGQDYIRTMNGIQVQTGATAEEMAEFGQIAQDIYKSGKGEDLQQIADTMTNIRQASGLAGEELKAAANSAMLLYDSFGMEAEETTRAATALMKNFGVSAEEAYGLIAVGAQNGANKNGDLLDTLNEYSVHYKALGLNASQFVDSLIKGADAGSFSIDKIGDAVKEFTIRAKDGSKTSAEGFKAIGLNAENMTAQFAAGGRAAEAAFFQTVQALNAIQDPVEKNAAGVALFGTMYEDLEAGVLKTLSNISGSGIDAVDALREIERIKYKDTGYALTQISRTLETALIPSAEAAGMALYDQMPKIQAAIEQVTPYIGALGESFAKAIPGIIDAVGSAVRVVYDLGSAVVDNWGVIGPILYTAAGAFAAFKLVKFAAEAYSVTKAVGQLTLAYGKLYVAKVKDGIETAKILALYAKDGAAKVLNTARTLASAAATQAQTVALKAWNAAAKVAQGVTKALGVAIRFMTGPIGLAITAIAGLVAAGVYLYKNWDEVKEKAAEVGEWVSSKWTDMKESVSAIVGELGAALSKQWQDIKDSVTGYVSGLGDAVSAKWQGMKDGVSSTVSDLSAAVSGTWASMKDAAAAKAGEIATSLGTSWSGIKDTVSDQAAQLGANLGAKWTEIKSVVSSLAGEIGDFVGNVWTRIKDGAASIGASIQGALSSAFSAIPGILKAPINAAISLINGAINAINGVGFTIPDWVPAIGGQAFSVNVPTIPMLARGGFTQGVSIAGEAGQEAVISFNPLYRKENVGYLMEAASLLGVTPPKGEGFQIPDWIPGIGSEALSIDFPKLPKFAAGGFTSGPSIAGEAGTEAVISFNPAYRQENLGYLARAASMLGVSREGETIGSYASRIESLSSGDSLAASSSSNVSTTTYNLGGINFAPTVTVKGGDEKKEDIIEQLRAYQGELLDMIEELLESKEKGSYAATAF